MAEVRSRSRRTESNWATICCSAFSCLQLYWARLVIRKWFNVSATESDYSADSDDDYEERVVQDLDPSSSGVTNPRVDTDDGPKLRRRNSETFRVQYMDTKAIRSSAPSTLICDVFSLLTDIWVLVSLFSFNAVLSNIALRSPTVSYVQTLLLSFNRSESLICGFDVARICAGTWNVGGRVPPADLDIDGWLDTAEPADIYVLGLQEIVPLNAGNIFGMEDDQPASEWENLIRDALNRVRPRKLKIVSHSDPPSPSKFKQSEEVSYSVLDMFVETSHDACDAIYSIDKKPSSNESTDRPVVGEDSLTNIDVLGSTNDNASSLPIQEYLPRQFSSPNTPDRSLSMHINSDSQREEIFSYTERVGLRWPEPPLKLLNQYVSERRGSFKSVNLTITNLRKPSYVRIVSKQMVGVFLTIWVRRSLRKHISNLCVSTVGVGIMGYIGNKGSVSVSMSIYQTPFCFLCSHLSSGEKDTDQEKRNDDVREIHRRTQFLPHSLNANELPRSIHDHERIIWLGDLNYRINLSYEKTHELIARKEWQRLVEYDQLSREMTKGKMFEGWSEGTLDFAPTYKYEINSESYIGDDPESGKRRPAWCDRIIWTGKGMKLFSYRRNEIKLSDHRPVTATFLAEVEVLSPRKLQRALTLTYAEIQGREAFTDF